MARNRKNGRSAIRLGSALGKALVLCLLVGGSGVGYVWQKEQIDRLSRQIDERGVRLARILDENENRKRLLAGLCTVDYLEARIKELNLGLSQPQPAQLWHLPEPPRQWPPAWREPQLSAHNNNSFGNDTNSNNNSNPRPAQAPRAQELTSR